MDEQVFSAEKICEMYPVLGTRSNLVSMVARGIGPPHYVIGNMLKYRRSEIEQWIEQQHRK